MEEIKDRRKQLEKEHETLKSQYVRIARDFDKFRKRQTRDQIELTIKLKIKIFQNILFLVDNFDRARHQLKPESEEAKKLNSHYQGIDKQLEGILKEQGVTSMLVVGKQFDPNLHEVVLKEPSEEFNENIITEELTRGYYLEGKVLRQSLVKVSTGKENGSSKKVYNLPKEEKSQKDINKIFVQDTLKDYINNVIKVPSLSLEEEELLILDIERMNNLLLNLKVKKNSKDLLSKQEYINIGKKAFIRMVEANQMLVLIIAHQFKNKGGDILDLIDAGNNGLEKSLYKFKPHRGYHFSLYSQWWIEYEIGKYLLDTRPENNNSLKFKDEYIARVDEVIKNGKTKYISEKFDLSEYENGDFLLKRGCFLYNLKRYKESIENIEKALKLDPENVEILFTLGNMKFDSGNYDEALNLYNRAIDLDPIDSKKAYLIHNRGLVNFELGKYEYASKDFEKANNINTLNGILFYNQANVKREIEDYYGAISDYDKAIELANNIKFINNRGMTYFDLEKYAEAKNDLQKVIKLNPFISNYWVNFGTCNLKLRKYKLSIDCFTQAIELDDQNPNAFYNRGLSKFYLNKHDEALKDFKIAIKLNSDDYDSHNEIGRIYYSRNEFERAIKSYDKSIKIKPNEYAFSNRGLAKYALGKYQGAINDFSKAIDLNSKLYCYFEFRGIAKYQLSRFDSSIKDFDKSITLNPNSSESFNFRGKAKLALKDYKSALSDFKKYKELDPSDDVDKLIKTCEKNLSSN